MVRAALVVAALVAACSSPSKLDRAEPKKAADPWDVPITADKDGDKGGGFDFSMLDRVADALKKPGAYEAPDKSDNYDASAKHFGVLALHGGIVERQAYSFSLFGGASRGTELRQIVARLREWATDDKLAGLVLRLDGVGISLPDVVELRAAMHEFRAAGKTLACHVEDAGNAAYLMLAACDRIGIAPLGQVAITGPAAMPIHVKGLLDKLGVQADFLHVGEYKGAAEPLTRDAPSKEMEETLGAILDRHYLTMVQIIAKDRKLPEDRVRALIDDGLFASEHAHGAQLVDDVASFEAFRDGVVGKGAWTKIELDKTDDVPDTKVGAISKIMRFLGAAPADRPSGDHVAIVYALGNIVDGDGDGVLGARQEIASHTLVAALRELTDDDSVKAVVLRIDSGGGSAQASELIWRAVAALEAKKPVIVSMSDVAASGGYYIASGATKIYALDNTLTGSIGVVGGKLAPGPALAKLGVTTFPMGRGKHATTLASLSPWTEDEKAIIQKSMEEVYDVFTHRVADGRKLAIAKVRELAKGRVWTGTKAKELGLVDEIGGLDAALAEARKLGSVPAEADVELYPPSPTLRDFIHGWGGVQVMAGVHAELAAIDPQIADAAERLVGLVLSFRATTIQLIAVLPEVR
jgi:protease-4